MRLKGHRHCLVGIALVDFHPQRAVTADTAGIYKVWDIRRTHTGEAICLQTFSADSELRTFTPRAIVSLKLLFW